MADKGSVRVLTVDVGNTTTRVGVFAISPLYAENGIVHQGCCELTTQQPITVDEARIQLAQARTLLPEGELDGAIMSCVVPSIANSWQQALAGISPTRPLVVGPGLKTGLRMRYDDPAEVGADRVADVVAAREAYETPVIVVDLGTTTNFEVIDYDGTFIGGIIAPGVALGARALSAAAARLPVIELRAPAQVVGKNTRAAMQSGVVLGEAARIDGLLDAIAGEMHLEPHVVITGENASSIAALLRHKATVDDALTLRGLALLWQKNRHQARA